MDEAASLRSEADAERLAAARCRAVAADLELRRGPLEARLDDLMAIHRADVWSSSAAESSRTMLHRYIGPGLAEVATAVAICAHELRARADELDASAAALSAAVADLAAAATVATISGDVGVGSIGPQIPPGLVR